MTSHPDFDEIRDITIIGAGPVGISTAFWAGMRCLLYTSPSPRDRS